MKILKLALLIICANSCASTVRESADAKMAIMRHKTIALLPVEVEFELSMKKLDALSREKVDSLKLYSSITLQNYLYHYLFLSGKGSANINVQDIDKTNNILNTNSIHFSEVFKGDKAILCKMLRVDAVLCPRIRFHEELTTIGAPLLAGSTGWGKLLMPTKPQHYARISFEIDDAVSEKPLWQMKHDEEYVFSAADKFLLSQRSNDKEALGPLYFLINDLAKPYLKKDPYKK